MKQVAKYIVSSFVLVIFCLYLVPHELVHVFYDHEDTKHATEHPGNAEFSGIHIHCDFLATDLIDFLPGEQPAKFECSSVSELLFAIAPVQDVQSHSLLRESRGPPVV